jgi:hypothetical protein
VAFQWPICRIKRGKVRLADLSVGVKSGVSLANTGMISRRNLPTQRIRLKHELGGFYTVFAARLEQVRQLDLGLNATSSIVAAVADIHFFWNA